MGIYGKAIDPNYSILYYENKKADICKQKKDKYNIINKDKRLEREKLKEEKKILNNLKNIEIAKIKIIFSDKKNILRDELSFQILLLKNKYNEELKNQSIELKECLEIL
jgi:tRNA A-37 threonylcarbamoyl transferase component Bud32